MFVRRGPRKVARESFPCTGYNGNRMIVRILRHAEPPSVPERKAGNQRILSDQITFFFVDATRYKHNKRSKRFQLSVNFGKQSCYG